MKEWKKIWIRVNVVSFTSILIFIFSEDISNFLGSPLLDLGIEISVFAINIMMMLGWLGPSLSAKECIKLFIEGK